MPAGMSVLEIGNIQIRPSSLARVTGGQQLRSIEVSELLLWPYFSGKDSTGINESLPICPGSIRLIFFGNSQLAVPSHSPQKQPILNYTLKITLSKPASSAYEEQL